MLFGDRAVVEPLLDGLPRLKARSKFIHTEVSIRMDDKPSQALRYGRGKSSMWLAIDAVKKGEADVAVSAGNTGALMAMARFNLKMIEGIDRPAIAGLWPTLKGESVVLDVGASIGADEFHLVNLAAMGGAMARILFDIERPTVGLLNIGVEEVKGPRTGARGRPHFARGQVSRISTIRASSRATISARARSMSSSPKALPAISRSRPRRAPPASSRNICAAAMNRTWMARLGYLLARQAFQTLREKMDPR